MVSDFQDFNFPTFDFRGNRFGILVCKCNAIDTYYGKILGKMDPIGGLEKCGLTGNQNEFFDKSAIVGRYICLIHLEDGLIF